MKDFLVRMDQLKEPTKIEWKKDNEYGYLECWANGQFLAWIEPRPAYCDRGHWKISCNLSDIDGADRFPRYFMSAKRAIDETEDFLKWRLWKIRVPGKLEEALNEVLREKAE